MTGEKDAPAEMPSVEEIARAIADNSGWRDAEPDARNAAYYLRLARVILNLFAPILAGKDAWAERGWNAFSIAHDQAMANGNAAQLAEARTLAAEADRDTFKLALIMEKERADMAVRQMIKQNNRLAALAQIAAPGAAMEAQ